MKISGRMQNVHQFKKKPSRRNGLTRVRAKETAEAEGQLSVTGGPDELTFTQYLRALAGRNQSMQKLRIEFGWKSMPALLRQRMRNAIQMSFASLAGVLSESMDGKVKVAGTFRKTRAVLSVETSDCLLLASHMDRVLMKMGELNRFLTMRVVVTK